MKEEQPLLQMAAPNQKKVIYHMLNYYIAPSRVIFFTNKTILSEDVLLIKSNTLKLIMDKTLPESIVFNVRELP